MCTVEYSTSGYSTVKCSFIDRHRELGVLSRAYSERPGFIVVYGRRRVGKTRLLLEWLRNISGRKVYYLAQLSSHQHNLRLLAETASQQLGVEWLTGITPQRLSSLLSMLANIGVEIVVIDEFTYWVRAAPLVVSELQEFVDLELPKTDMLLVVAGSLMGVMKRDLLGGGSPLYARTTTRLVLYPLDYRYLKCFLPHLSPQDRVRVYSLIGGLPYYACLLTGSRSFDEIIEKLFSPGSPLIYEKDLVLREELQEPQTYNAVLSALAQGYNTPSRIADVAGIDPGHANKTLHVLEYLGFVRRERPLFRKKGYYVIADPILRTWYTLVEPVIYLLEMGREKVAWATIASRIDYYTALVWEELVRSHLAEKFSPRGYTLVGRLVHKGEEIDIALLNPEEKKAILGEAKWSKLRWKDVVRIAGSIYEKAERILPQGYRLEEVIVAVRELTGSIEREQKELVSIEIVTPESLERGLQKC